MIARRLIARLLFGLFAVGFAAVAQEINGPVDSFESTLEQRASEYVRARLGFTENKFLRAVRREDFEDDLFAGQIKLRGQIHKAARFFDVTETGYEIVSRDEAVFHSSVDGAGRWVVAVGSTSGRVYGISGFEGSISDFNRLIEDSNVRIVSEESATSWALFFLNAVVSDKNGLWLSGPFDLRRAAEDVIAGHALTRKHSITAAQWLRTLESHRIKPVIGVFAQKLREDYQVTADSVSVTNEFMPLLKETKFRILANGIVADESVVNLFPPSADVN